ncbi:MAG: FAD-dependent monooxygenase [Granulosicoccus sp.]
MRPAGRGEKNSLYFTYPHFDPPDPSTRNSKKNIAPVAIVGAGPIGMTAALALAKEGVPSVVFDKKCAVHNASHARVEIDARRGLVTCTDTSFCRRTCQSPTNESFHVQR